MEYVPSGEFVLKRIHCCQDARPSLTRPIELMSNPSPSRKDFLKRSGQVLGTAWLLGDASGVREAAAAAVEAARHQEPYGVLRPEEVRELEAVAEQIIPTTDTPGARDAGVVRFMDTALDGFAAGMLPPIRAGLEDLRGRTAEVHSADVRFSDLEFDDQTALLRQFEPTPFFQTVRFLTIAGMFSLPSYGGNRDGAGWEVIGFEERPIWQPPFGYYDERIREGDPGDGGVGR